MHKSNFVCKFYLNKPTMKKKRHFQKTQKIGSVGKDVEKLKPLYIAGENVKWCSHYEKECRNFLRYEK